jgi:hypothetical protein
MIAKCKTCKREVRRAAKGMCAACYMRKRRRDKAGPAFVHRSKAGSREAIAIEHRDDWVHRFDAMVDRSGACHEWVGGRTAAGYGVFHACGATYLAHRLAFVLAGGGLGCDVVMHSCDNPCCVNPAHLAGGTHKDNAGDMVAKGRQNVTDACGAQLRDRQSHPRAKAVSTPKGDFASASLAADVFGVSARTIQKRASDGVDGFAWL